jgi:hypothetical protein
MKLAEHPEVYRECCEELSRLGTFELSLSVPSCRETVIRPLLAHAAECLIYGLESGTHVWNCVQPIVSPYRG